MRIPSIDELMNHIHDARSKECMKEVLSCFYSDNLRSAVVMLYATVVSDLYYKILDLVAIYNDAGAKQIKQYVDNEWQSNPKLPTWETEMPKMCWKKKKILTNDSYAHFCHLQDERNLCAHPVITRNDLYRPSFATVQGLITDMLTGILCKPSFLSKGFIDTFTDDIESASKNFPNEKGLKRYINTKYLEKIDNEQEEYGLFKSLWKFTFKKTDDRSKANRQENLSILILLLERHQQFVESEIKNDAEYYCASVNMDDDNCVKEFICFANIYQSVFSSMTDDFKMQIEQKINGNSDLHAMAFFLSGNPLVHAKKVDSNIGANIGLYMYDYLKQNVGDADARDFVIEVYGNANSYDAADDYFDNLIESILGDMSEEQLVKLIEYSNNNGQIYGRRKFPNSRWLIKNYMSKKNPLFDYSLYVNFD